MLSGRFHQAIWREASLDSEDKRTAKLWSWHVHVIIATTRCALHAAVFLRESSALTSVRIMFYPKVNHSQRFSYSCCVQNWNISLFGPKRVFLLREFFQRRCFGKRRISKQKSFLCEEFRRSLMACGFQDPLPFQQRNQLQWKVEDVIEFCYCRGGEHGQMFVMMKTAANV